MSKAAAARAECKVATNQRNQVNSEIGSTEKANNNNKNKCLKMPTKKQKTLEFLCALVCGKENLFLIFILSIPFDFLFFRMPSSLVYVFSFGFLIYFACQMQYCLFHEFRFAHEWMTSIVINEFVHKKCQIEAGCCRFLPHVFVQNGNKKKTLKPIKMRKKRK